MKKRILHVISSVSAGGIESLVVALFENINREQFSFDLAVFNPNQPIHQLHLEELGAKIHFISNAGCGSSVASKVLWRIKAIWNYAILIRRNQYDAVHCHNFNNFGLYILLAAMRRIPVRIVHSHNAGSLREKSINKFMRRVKNIANFDWLITQKIGCSQMAAEWLYGSGTDAKVIYNGIDVEKYSSRNMDRAFLRASYKLADGIQFVNVGRFSTQKNQHFLIDIFYEMTKLEDDLYLNLVGFGPLETSLRERVVELGLDLQVTFLGFDTHIPGLLSVMDFFLLPSLWEGLPVTAIEAQCAGVPIFIGDTVTKEVNMGLAIYLPLSRGAKYWAEYILKTIRAKSYPQHIDSERMELFDIKNVAREFEKLYVCADV